MSDRITTRELYDAVIEVDKKLAVNNEHTKGIEDHLDKLNSKVAKNVDKLIQHEKDISGLHANFNQVYTKVNDWEIDFRENKKYWSRKVIWWVFTSICALITAGLVASGVITW